MWKQMHAFYCMWPAFGLIHLFRGILQLNVPKMMHKACKERSFSHGMRTCPAEPTGAASGRRQVGLQFALHTSDYKNDIVQSL